MNATELFDATVPWWGWCVALVFPLAAVLHHALFFRGSCMINPFGPDYTRSAVKAWLKQDPSLRWAALAAFAVYLFGLTSLGQALRVVVAAFVIGFIPATAWIWDIPGSGRWICRHFHDDVLHAPGVGPIRTRHVYLLSLMLSALALLLLLRGL